MARWTEIKDFRDDCRSVKAAGLELSSPCEEALSKDLMPPPYISSSFYNRLAKRGFQAKVETLRFSRTCFHKLWSMSRALLLEFRSLHVMNRITGLLFRIWGNVMSASKPHGTLRENMAVWIEGLRSWIAMIMQLARNQAKDLACYAQDLAYTLPSWFQRLLVHGIRLGHKASSLYNALPPQFRGCITNSLRATRKLSSLFQPWMFEGALFLLVTVQRFWFNSITTWLYILFVDTVAVNKHALWSSSCDDCFDYWGIIAILFDIYWALALLPFKLDEDVPMGASASNKNHLLAITMPGIIYNFVLVLDAIIRPLSITGYSILGATLLSSAFWCYALYSRRRYLHVFDVLRFTTTLLTIHVAELCVIVYWGTLVSLSRIPWRCWKFLKPWFFKLAVALFWGMYGLDIFALFLTYQERKVRFSK